MKRPLVVAASACAAGALLVLLAAGRTWGAATARAAIAARQHVAVTGHEVAPSLPALGLALLALSVALLAARGLLRRVLALLVVVSGAAVVGVAVNAQGDVGRALASKVFASSTTTLGGTRAVWWVVALLGGALAAAAGATIVVRGGRWAGMGARYDAPGATPQPDREADAWEAIDQGHDPTIRG